MGTYKNLGSGKCLKGGKDPRYSYHGGQGSSCKSMCDGRSNCHGYSVSSFNNCLLWSEAGLTGGGAAWGGASCLVKAGSAASPTPRPTPRPTVVIPTPAPKKGGKGGKGRKGGKGKGGKGR